MKGKTSSHLLHLDPDQAEFYHPGSNRLTSTLALTTPHAQVASMREELESLRESHTRHCDVATFIAAFAL